MPNQRLKLKTEAPTPGNLVELGVDDYVVAENSEGQTFVCWRRLDGRLIHFEVPVEEAVTKVTTL